MKGGTIMGLEELQVYNLSMEMGERIWAIAIKWDYFAKDTVTRQLIKAADSVASNLSEGYGRYHYKENKQFCYYSRGSLHETNTWLTKAQNRALLDAGVFRSLRKDISVIGIKLNNYISSIGK
jgi:four helix bundle protein